jgi:uncharacterized membrane protein
MKKISIFTMLALLLVSVFAVSVQADEVPATFENMWLNNRLVTDDQVRGDLRRGETVELEFEVLAAEDVFDATIEVEIDGSEHGSASSETDVFDMKAGHTYFKTLTLDLSDNLDRDTYTVHVELKDRRNDRVSITFTLDVGTERHDITVEDVLFSPSKTVKAGRSLLVSARVENRGEDDEKDVKVTFSIPDLGVSDSDYIDEVETDEEKMSEELFVRIDECAEAGDYNGLLTVEYDDGYQTTTESFTITVMGNDKCQSSSDDRTVITVGPESQNIVAGGSEAVYPLALTNAGSDSRTYTVSVTTGDWATSRVSSTVLVVGAGETKVTNIFVAADEDAAAGEKLVSVAVMSGDKTLQEANLKANVVTSGSSTSLKRALEVGLVVLVVLLVIVGLIVGFSRLKSDDEGKDDETYY